jgi:predicted kinase
MPKLYITRGLPASGKTTLAKEMVNADPKIVRVNRDDLRAMSGVPWSKELEQRIVKQRDMLIDEFLCRDNDVINDDTNLPQRTVRDLATIAKRCGADFEVLDLTHVSLDECLYRNAQRDDKYPLDELVIIDMYKRYLKGKQLPLPVPELKNVNEQVFNVYVPDDSKPTAFIFDIDGTVAHMNGRSPYDYSRVSEDLHDEFLLYMAHTLRDAGCKIIFVSGRKDSCRDDTIKWLDEHFVGLDYELYMRKADDNRNDSIVKYELFNEHIRDNWWVGGVFDDRQRVVDMWRKIGLKCYQVAPGQFLWYT